MENGWNGLPYRPISDHYKNLFGGKVYKIPVAVAESCPNREGLKGMTTCVFCDQWGSAARIPKQNEELKTQIERIHAIIAKKYKPEHFLVYFQAYTNTFLKLKSLEENFKTALSFPYVKGFVLGTRPDCISPAVLNLWNEYQQKTYVGVEIGAQSFFNDQLEFLKRGHTAEQTIKALELISQKTKVDLGIHLMFGLPGETDDHILKTAEICNQLPISNVKLHNLHVLKDTPLADIYTQGQFTPISRELYSHRVQLFIEHLSPKIFVHRLAAYSSRWDELVAPAWTADKMGTHQYLIDELREKSSHQSKIFLNSLNASSEEKELALFIQKQSSKSSTFKIQ